MLHNPTVKFTVEISESVMQLVNQLTPIYTAAFHTKEDKGT